MRERFTQIIQKIEKEMIVRKRLEEDRQQKERLEKKRLEREMLERMRIRRKRLDKMRLERMRIEKKKLEDERLERVRIERKKLEDERLERARIEREKLEDRLRPVRERIERDMNDIIMRLMKYNRRRFQKDKSHDESNIKILMMIRDRVQSMINSEKEPYKIKRLNSYMLELQDMINFDKDPLARERTRERESKEIIVREILEKPERERLEYRTDWIMGRYKSIEHAFERIAIYQFLTCSQEDPSDVPINERSERSEHKYIERDKKSIEQEYICNEKRVRKRFLIQDISKIQSNITFGMDPYINVRLDEIMLEIQNMINMCENE